MDQVGYVHFQTGSTPASLRRLLRRISRALRILNIQPSSLYIPSLRYQHLQT